MMKLVKVYLLSIPLFLLLDYLWLGRIMAGFYREGLGTLARRSGDAIAPLPWATVLVYLLIPLGIVLFALPRTSAECPLLSGLLWGFLYGVTLYGVYDMTNLSVLEKWPVKMALVDIVWGGVICSIVTCFAAVLHGWLK
jgi:uncharacterized membrane protein